MNLILQLRPFGFVPADVGSAKYVREKLKMGERYEVTVKKNRSVPQTRLLFAFLEFVTENQERFPSLDSLRDNMAFDIGFTRKMKRIVIEEGKPHYFSVTEIPRSFSFRDCSADEARDYVDRAADWCQKQFGISMDEWSKAEREGICKADGCQAVAVETHHVLGGLSFRARSEELGLVIRLCRRHHQEAEGEAPSHLNRESWEKQFCRTLGVDWAEMSGAVKSGVKKYKLKTEA